MNLVMRASALLFSVVLFVLAADESVRMRGSWSSGSSGNGGTLELQIATDSSAQKSKATFTAGGETVPCKVTKAKVDGDNLEITYSFDLGGYTLESAVKGTRKGDKVDGSYETRPVGGGDLVDQGTFSASISK